MTLTELKDKLYKYNVPERWYSLQNGIKDMACNLFKNDNALWEYFYFERGERSDHRVFTDEEEAFDYFWKRMEFDLDVFKIPPRKAED